MDVDLAYLTASASGWNLRLPWDGPIALSSIGSSFTVPHTAHEEYHYPNTPLPQCGFLIDRTWDFLGSATFVPLGVFGKPPKALSDDMRKLLKSYADDVKVAASGLALAGGVMAVLAGVPEPVVTKGSVALWGLSVGVVALTGAVMTKLANDPPTLTT
jgi:hypothetical protein